jgi:hypothetical protein
VGPETYNHQKLIGRMSKMTRHIFSPRGLLTVVAILLVVSGCGRKARIVEEKPVLLETRWYETLWVEPEVIVSDTLITLIRSERIDSVRIDPSAADVNRPAAIELRIGEPVCNVSIGLLDSRLRLVHPLLLRRLPAGFYRLTLNIDRLREPPLPPGTYFVKADYCGRAEMTLFSVP